MSPYEFLYAPFGVGGKFTACMTITVRITAAMPAKIFLADFFLGGTTESICSRAPQAEQYFDSASNGWPHFLQNIPLSSQIIF